MGDAGELDSSYILIESRSLGAEKEKGLQRSRGGEGAQEGAAEREESGAENSAAEVEEGKRRTGHSGHSRRIEDSRSGEMDGGRVYSCSSAGSAGGNSAERAEECSVKSVIRSIDDNGGNGEVDKNYSDGSVSAAGTEDASSSAMRKRKYTRDDKFINILTPKKDRANVFLTPVKRTRRSVINGLKSGTIKVFDNSVEVRSNNTPYASLVECFRRLEKAERQERRESIDRIVKKYSSDNTA
ncbi:hypothetical protein NEMIN01_0810 [Nematocida minor]|uniref:uncharacterized protein n=1 Tax=Nematocida minor TaxID=1912983 RepID=UPI00221F6DB5|nr:uncharacterized protein NEMIN01_0810 [Nematocida minor]KAI5190025.1 hypothetical protein NEMIN01_0810 [Nematocida minor]